MYNLKYRCLANLFNAPSASQAKHNAYMNSHSHRSNPGSANKQLEPATVKKTISTLMSSYQIVVALATPSQDPRLLRVLAALLDALRALIPHVAHMQAKQPRLFATVDLARLASSLHRLLTWGHPTTSTASAELGSARSGGGYNTAANSSESEWGGGGLGQGSDSEAMLNGAQSASQATRLAVSHPITLSNPSSPPHPSPPLCIPLFYIHLYLYISIYM